MEWNSGMVEWWNGIVEWWNGGMVEWWNSGMLESLIIIIDQAPRSSKTDHTYTARWLRIQVAFLMLSSTPFIVILSIVSLDPPSLIRRKKGAGSRLLMLVTGYQLS